MWTCTEQPYSISAADAASGAVHNQATSTRTAAATLLGTFLLLVGARRRT